MNHSVVSYCVTAGIYIMTLPATARAGALRFIHIEAFNQKFDAPSPPSVSAAEGGATTPPQAPGACT